MSAQAALRSHDVTLVELVDRVLNKGVVLQGDVILSVAGVDLVYVTLRVLLASVGTLDELLSLERVDGIGAVVGAIDGEIAPSEDAVLRHARVVEAVAALNAAVLPVRFGRGFAGRAELRQAIRDHA